MLAQVIGNLNGLPHEFKYINEPGQIERYAPGLPKGAQTDDDTDIEWVYLREIARSRDVGSIDCALSLCDGNLDIVKNTRDLLERRRALANQFDRFVAQR